MRCGAHVERYTAFGCFATFDSTRCATIHLKSLSLAFFSYRGSPLARHSGCTKSTPHENAITCDNSVHVHLHPLSREATVLAVSVETNGRQFPMKALISPTSKMSNSLITRVNKKHAAICA